MTRIRISLERQILAARREERLDVAEKLLEALETLEKSAPLQ